MTLVLAVLVLAVPSVTSAQTSAVRPDDPLDLLRVTLMVDALEHLNQRSAEASLRGASQSDIAKMLWVIETRRQIQAGTLPIIAPPSPTYQPDYRQPVYSTTPAYPSPTVITANPYLGTPLSQYDPRVNQYSPNGAQNPYTTSGGKIYGSDGTYLGKLNANPYDPESVANPYGKYGSPYSPTSIKSPYSPYGSPYSPKSATNPYTVTPPRVIYGDTTNRK
jgi:hypothetical protein